MADWIYAVSARKTSQNWKTVYFAKLCSSRTCNHGQSDFTRIRNQLDPHLHHESYKVLNAETGAMTLSTENPMRVRDLLP